MNTIERTAPLGSLVEMIGGGTPSKARSEYYKGHIPWVTPKDMKAWYIDDAQDHITEEAVASSSTKVVDPHSVLLVIRSGVLKHTLPVAINRVPVALNQDMKALRCRADLDPFFLARFLQHRAPLLLQTARGTTADNISSDVIRSLAVPLLPMEEQQRIAAILGKAHGIRQKREHQKANIDELIRASFMETVGPQARHYSAWKPRKIEHLAANFQGSMRTGPFGSDLKHSEFVDEGIAVLGIDNAVQNSFAWGERRYITPEKYERLQRYRVYPGDVIITIMGTTGRSAVVPDDIPTAITTKHLATISLDRDQAEPEFVSNAIHRHPEALRQIRGANRGAIMNGLNLGLIRSIELRMPPIEIQRDFTKAVDQIRKFDSRIDLGIEVATSLFDSLVSRAFQGEL